MTRSKTDHKMHLHSQVKGEFYMQVDLTIWRQRGKQDANFTRKHTLVGKKPVRWRRVFIDGCRARDVG